MISDVVPLVKLAFQNSFANVSSAKKAIGERGWCPLNYMLLDHPTFSQQNPLPKPDLVEQNISPSIVSEVNTTAGFSGDVFTTIFEDLEVQKGHKKRIEAQREDMRRREKGLEALTIIGKNYTSENLTTSGELAIVGKYCFDEEVVSSIKRKSEKRQKEARTVIENQEKKRNESTKRYNDSFKRLTEENLPLRAGDYKSFIQQFKLKTDSPMKSKESDLRDQWLRRRHRMEKTAPGIWDKYYVAPTTRIKPSVVTVPHPLLLVQHPANDSPLLVQQPANVAPETRNIITSVVPPLSHPLLHVQHPANNSPLLEQQPFNDSSTSTADINSYLV